MALGSLAGVIPRLRSATLSLHGVVGDAELLDRFLTTRDEAAFELLVRRHGPMVFAVCRRVLRHTHDAEDAFQATFLVLAHRAAAVSPRSRLAGWLHGVAYKTALKARHRAARRAVVEQGAPVRSTGLMPPESNWDDAEPLLDQELAALPERYRLPIVFCDLEGRLRAEVATTLGCSEGTLSSRLTRGRRLLADRLKRRGVHLSVAALAVTLTERSVALAEPLIRMTVPAALSALSAPAGVAGTASPSVAELATGVMKSMFLKKLQAVAVAAFAVATVALALAGLAADRSEAAPVPKVAPAPTADDKALTEALADVDGHLLMNRKVLKDLKCDFDQFDTIMDRLEAAQQQANKKTAEAMGQLRFNAGGNGGPDAFNKMIREAQEAGAKDFRKAVATVVADALTPAQRKRLREIDIQARGHEAFTTPAVAKSLDLSAKQKEQFEANARRVEKEIAQALPRPGGGVAAAGAGPAGGVVVGGFNLAEFEKVGRDVRAEGLKRALAVLTDEQKATWKKLVGDPFAHPLDRPAQSRTWGAGGGVIQFGGAVPLLPAVPAVPAVPGANVVPGKALPAVPPGN